MHDKAVDALWNLIEKHGEIDGVSRFERQSDDYDHIGGGNTRHVFTYARDAVVVKIARDNHTTYANSYEASTWQNGPNGLKEYLAPVHGVADNRTWLVQQEVDATAPPNWKLVKEEFEDVGLDTIDITEDNVGNIDGDPVAYDYPFNQF